MAAVEFHGRVMASELHIITDGRHDRRWSPTWSADARSPRAVLEPVHPDQRHQPHQRRRAGGALAVDDSTITLLAAMIEGHQCTGGRFDPTVLPALIAAGLRRQPASTRPT